MSDSKITSALGLRPINRAKPEAIEAEEVTSVTVREETPSTQLVEGTLSPAEDKEMLEDIDFARNNVRKSIETGNKALEAALHLAVSSESPKAYEMVADLIRTMTMTNERYLEIAEKRKFEKSESSGGQGRPTTPANVTNNLIVTTAELLSQLKSAKEE